MDFKEATDRLMEAGFTAADIGAGLGLATQTIRAMRLDPSSSSYRNPQGGWRKALAKLAHQRGEELRGLAEALDAEAGNDG